MPDLDPFDMDVDGDVDDVDFLGLDYLMHHVLRRESDEDEEDLERHDPWNDEIRSNV